MLNRHQTEGFSVPREIAGFSLAEESNEPQEARGLPLVNTDGANDIALRLGCSASLGIETSVG